MNIQLYCTTHNVTASRRLRMTRIMLKQKLRAACGFTNISLELLLQASVSILNNNIVIIV